MSNKERLAQFPLDMFNEQVIQATIDKCAQFHNPRILNAIKSRWIEILSERMNAIQCGKDITHLDISEDPAKCGNLGDILLSTAKSEGESDDEFLDAEVESAHPTDKNTRASDSLDNEAPKTSVECDAKEQPSYHPSSPNDSDISMSEISDLDDQEPETRDIVIGLLDKITRPSSKRSGTPLWKLKLKYGIIQVNGVEVPFDTLEGDFEF